MFGPHPLVFVPHPCGEASFIKLERPTTKANPLANLRAIRPTNFFQIFKLDVNDFDYLVTRSVCLIESLLKLVEITLSHF